MPAQRTPPQDTEGPEQGRGPEPARLRRLLRYSHVFSAAVREILEARYLGEVSPDPLTLPQFHLLKLIALNGRHQVGEVAEFLGVSSPAATKNIDKLERLGLVTRAPSEGDRRATLLSASQRGHRLVRRYERLKAERLAPVLSKFRPDEIDQLARLLERFSVLLFERESPEDGYCLRCAAYCQERCPIGHVLGNCPYEKIRARNRPGQRDAEGSR
ncbi:MAG: MarR family winged helix-turn-helix transcriptional regulator [Acidobacteriota bacterium]